MISLKSDSDIRKAKFFCESPNFSWNSIRSRVSIPPYIPPEVETTAPQPALLQVVLAINPAPSPSYLESTVASRLSQAKEKAVREARAEEMGVKEGQPLFIPDILFNGDQSIFNDF